MYIKEFKYEIKYIKYAYDIIQVLSSYHIIWYT